ncbi:G-type lectin S-receptor-like serine/threonine-protein kinase At4g27290 [Coffea eugenioides]|uniref:G-type lectin S-receptor-like serine/threonine-protein kinase At4g27290 n=1 Tax=Coffea eugenioides TaxID=49369 RepID=UPI000F60F716|nr:G-type lectin S-receptor-like serine/threonine-protein kinase At4g27290 [Coffea eugenioides]
MKSFHRICCFCFLLPHFIVLSDATDTLALNETLADGKTIISSGGTFELGFYSPDSSSNNRYVGIWYKQVSPVVVVWIANRDVPVNGTNGLLKVTDQSKLTIFNGEGTAIWSTNSTRLVQKPVAQLLDSGNLVVKDAADANPANYLWQSFDHPTDTLLPGMKLGLDWVKGINRYLQSSKSKADPSRGYFTYQMDPNGFPQLFLMNDSIPQFRSGTWDGKQFIGSPGLNSNPLYTYEFVNTPQEIYYRFDLYSSSVYSILTLKSNGVLQRLNYNPRNQDWTDYLDAPADSCDDYGLCNAYGICSIVSSPFCSCLDKFVPVSPFDWQTTDWSSGCKRRVPLDCQKGDGFLKYSGIKLPDTRHSRYNQSMSLKECEKLCMKNCSCTAYSNSDTTGKGSVCLLWFDNLIDIKKLSDSDQYIYIRVASSELGSGSNKGKIIVISLVLPAAVLLLVLSLILYFKKKKKKQQRTQTEQLSGEVQIGGTSERYPSREYDKEDVDLPLFDWQTVVQATNYFSSDNKLGAGGFGPVYKGILVGGQEIAVKRLSEYSMQGLDEFKNEVKLIANLKHRNLVKLLGCCIQAKERILIYEYMPNRSLDSFIFDHDRSRLLDWPKRFQIINGIARGLLYLHRDSRLRIIHRDLKAGNVLLDIDMKPKISDFGMARIFANENEANTKRVVGTYGYMPPEYVVDGYYSTKSDVYSFGVLVLEIVTGRKNRGFTHASHNHNLLGHAWLLYKDGRFQELVDDHVSKSCYLSEVIRSIHVGLLCVQQFPDDRPSMSSVVLMLASDRALPFPKEPGYFTQRNLFFEPEKSLSSTKADSSSNQLTVTMLDAR